MHYRTVRNQGEFAMRKIGFLGIMMIFAFAAAAHAQDPVKLHPDIFKVEFENSQVRVLRVTLAPHQKTELHEMHDAVVVPLADYESVIHQADGKRVEVKRLSGKPEWLPAGSREIEAGNKPVAAIVTELKGADANTSAGK
jgi:hypothetical protein